MTENDKRCVQVFITDRLNDGTFDGPELDVIEEAVGHEYRNLKPDELAQVVKETVEAWTNFDFDEDAEDDDPDMEDDDPAEDGDASEDDDPAEDGDADEDGWDDEDDARDED